MLCPADATAGPQRSAQASCVPCSQAGRGRAPGWRRHARAAAANRAPRGHRVGRCRGPAVLPVTPLGFTGFGGICHQGEPPSSVAVAEYISLYAEMRRGGLRVSARPGHYVWSGREMPRMTHQWIQCLSAHSFHFKIKGQRRSCKGLASVPVQNGIPRSVI